MKKMTKRAIAVVLVLVLTLSLFAGCGARTDSEYLAEEYGMTFDSKSVTYDGEEHSIEVAVSELASGKDYSVSYTYEKDGSVITGNSATEAGEYKITAEINDGSDQKTYKIDTVLEIKPATLKFNVPNQYVKVDTNAKDPADVFADLKLKGQDKVEDLGLAWTVKDINKLDEMEKVKDGKKLDVTISNSNYKLDTTAGELFVLSYKDFTAASSLIFNVEIIDELQEKFDELSYAETNQYINASEKVLDVFDSPEDYTEIQVAMIGSFNEEDVRANLVVSEKRITQGYDLDWDVTGEISKSDLEVTDDEVFAVFKQQIGTSEDTKDEKFDVRPTDREDDDISSDRYYINEGFIVDYLENGRTGEEEYDDYEGQVKYNDTFYFVIKAFNEIEEDKNTVADYVINTLSVRDKDVDYDDGDLVEVNDKEYKIYTLRVDSETLGSFSKGGGISVEVNSLSQYVPAFNDDTSSHNDNEYVSRMNITADRVDVFEYADGSVTSGTKPLIVGEEYTLSIYAEDGFAIKTIRLGDYEIDASDLVDNQYTFTVVEEMFDAGPGDSFNIEVETTKAFDVEVKIDNRTIRQEDGMYKTDSGSVDIKGMQIDGSDAIIGEGGELNLTFGVEDDFILTSVKLFANNGTGDLPLNRDADTEVELVKEIANDGTLSIDVSEDSDYFDFEDITDATTLRIEIDFNEYYDVEVKAEDSNITFKQNASGTWSSDYATIEILDTDEELLTGLADTQKYMIYASDIKDGYIISEIKINDRTATAISKGTGSTGANSVLSSYALDVIGDNSAYFFQNSEYIGSDPNFRDIETAENGVKDGDKYTIEPVDVFFNASDANVKEGEDLVIEITFDTYYEVEFDSNVSNADLDTAELAKVEELYKYDNDQAPAKTEFVFFGSDDGSSVNVKLNLTSDWYAEMYEEHTGFDASDSSPTGDDDDNIDEVLFYLESNGKEVDSDDMRSSDFDAYEEADDTSTISFAGIDFSDLMKTANPGDNFLVEIYDDIIYN